MHLQFSYLHGGSFSGSWLRRMGRRGMVDVRKL
jgi:hypothetical protein